MAHLQIVYSANLGDQGDVPALVGALHNAALATGVVTVDALRTYADAPKHHAVGDRDPSNVFVAVVVRIGPSRSAEEKRQLIDALAEAAERSLGHAANNAMISVECQEIDADFRINRNRVRDAIQRRASGS